MLINFELLTGYGHYKLMGIYKLMGLKTNKIFTRMYWNVNECNFKKKILFT